MRIAVNASIVDPIPSGLGIYAVKVLQELAKLHDDLVVYTSLPESLGLRRSQLRRISPGVQPFHGRRGHLQRLLWAQTALPLRLLSDRAGILFSPLPEGMLLPVTPQVVVVHDVLPLHFPEEYPRQQYYFRYFVPRILRRSRAVIAVSEQTRQDVERCYGIGGGDVHVVPNGYEKGRFRTGVHVESVRRKYGLGPYALYVGNLLPHKNLCRLINAFTLVSGKVPHMLVIAGKKDPRYYPALEADAMSLGVGERVLFLDYVPHEELPALYAGADVFILPSLYEGFGLPILEAMACGTPVIASRAASLQEVAGDAALLVDPNDVRSLAEALAAVLSAPQRRASMRERGLEQAERFDWAETARMILEVLRRVPPRRPLRETLTTV